MIDKTGINPEAGSFSNLPSELKEEILSFVASPSASNSSVSGSDFLASRQDENCSTCRTYNTLKDIKNFRMTSRENRELVESSPSVKALKRFINKDFSVECDAEERRFETARTHLRVFPMTSYSERMEPKAVIERHGLTNPKYVSQVHYNAAYGSSHGGKDYKN